MQFLFPLEIESKTVLRRKIINLVATDGCFLHPKRDKSETKRGEKNDPYRENAMRQLFVTNAFRKMLRTKSLPNVVCSPKACFMQPIAWCPNNKPHYSHRVQVQHETIHQAFITDMWLSAQRKKQFKYITFSLCLWLIPKEHPWSSSYSSCELLQWMVHLIPHVAWGQEGRSVDDLLLACLLLDDTPSSPTCLDLPSPFSCLSGFPVVSHLPGLA